MRCLLFALLPLLLFGCGGDSTVSTAPLVDPLPGQHRLVVTRDNALRLARAVEELTVPSGRNSVELAGGDLSRIEIDGVAAALVEMPLAYPILSQRTSERFTGPGGGFAELDVNGSGVTVTFADFVTEDGTELDGVAFMAGQARGLEGEVGVTFGALQLTDADGAFQIDGPVLLSLTRVNGPEGFVERVRRTLNVTVTDLGTGGTVHFLDWFSDSDIEVKNGVQTGSSNTGGPLSFNGYAGFRGLLESVPEDAYDFSVDTATHISSVSSGQSLLVGNGTLRRRIVATNIFEIAVRAAGTSEFEVVGTTDITDIDHQ